LVEECLAVEGRAGGGKDNLKNQKLNLKN